MTVRQALAEGGAVLGASAILSGSDTARLDASLLLARCLCLSRSRLLAELSLCIDEAVFSRFRDLIAARASGKPVAYLIGMKEFYGRKFHVDENVLIPRPDTEILVEVALLEGDFSATGPDKDNHTSVNHADGDHASAPGMGGDRVRRIRVHEACTGSGAVAITLAAERPDWDVSASDISGAALDVARRNSLAILGREIPFLQSDLVAAVGEGFDLILANPPYVSSLETDSLLARGWSEPRLALDGGKDGLDLYRTLIPGALHHLAPGGLLFVESDSGQAAVLRNMFSDEGYSDVRSIDDLAGLARVTGGRKPWKT